MAVYFSQKCYAQTVGQNLLAQPANAQPELVKAKFIVQKPMFIEKHAELIDEYCKLGNGIFFFRAKL